MGEASRLLRTAPLRRSFFGELCEFVEFCLHALEAFEFARCKALGKPGPESGWQRGESGNREARPAEPLAPGVVGRRTAAKGEQRRARCADPLFCLPASGKPLAVANRAPCTIDRSRRGSRQGLTGSRHVELGEDAAVVDGTLPFMALAFRGRIEESIKQNLRKALEA